MTTETRNRTASHRRTVAAVTLLAALLAVAHAVPARAQASMSPSWPGSQPGGQPGNLPGNFPGNQAGAQPGGGASLDQMTAWERRDMGVAAPQGLREGGMHGATPNQIPGGQVITTKGLLPLLQQGMQVHVFDVLGGPEALPNAIPAAWASQAGSFDDSTQQQLGQMLRQVTRGQTDAPLVFYCQSADCWMSYNAAVRAIRLGYRNVLWYRGGVEAWKSAGLPMGRSSGQWQPQMGQPQMGQPQIGQPPMGQPPMGQPSMGQPQGARPPGALPPDAFGPMGGRS